MIKLYQQFERLWFALHQKFRFLLVGGFNTLLAYALFVFFIDICKWHYSLVLIVQYIITINISIFTMRYYVFQSQGNLKREYTRAWSVYLFLLLLNYVYLFISVSYLELPPIIAQGIYIIVSTILTFVLHKKYSFQ